MYFGLVVGIGVAMPITPRMRTLARLSIMPLSGKSAALIECEAIFGFFPGPRAVAAVCRWCGAGASGFIIDATQQPFAVDAVNERHRMALSAAPCCFAGGL